MMYEDLVRDFAARTIDNYKRISNEPYEVTQLINSAVGLLVIPQQKHYNKISDKLVSEELLDKMKQCVESNSYKKALNLQQIARHLRNSIAHARMSFKGREKGTGKKEIESVVFEDENEYSGEYVRMNIPVEVLREFFLAFADAVSVK